MNEPTSASGRRSTQHEEWAELMHDLRTPMTVVLGRVQLARRHLRRGDGIAQADADLEALEAAIIRLAATVERLDRGGRPD